jgi:hypothetical protein
MGDDPFRRDPPPIELTDPFDLIRRKAGQIAVYLFDIRSSRMMENLRILSPSFIPYLNFSGLTRFSIRSRKVDQEFVRKAAGRRWVCRLPQAGHDGFGPSIFINRSKIFPHALHSYS